MSLWELNGIPGGQQWALGCEISVFPLDVIPVSPTPLVIPLKFPAIQSPPRDGSVLFPPSSVACLEQAHFLPKNLKSFTSFSAFLRAQF